MGDCQAAQDEDGSETVDQSRRVLRITDRRNATFLGLPCESFALELQTHDKVISSQL
jgi:hypothetical protein